MRKRIINQRSKELSRTDQGWLDLERLAQVEITSEDEGDHIESALTSGVGQGGWRASQPGEQTIRLLFDEPQQLRRIRLVFDESTQERTHEFVLRWSSDGGQSYREILRQQYTFSPQGITHEAEEYVVNLDGVSILELIILPDISGGDAHASLTQLRLA